MITINSGIILVINRQKASLHSEFFIIKECFATSSTVGKEERTTPLPSFEKITSKISSIINLFLLVLAVVDIHVFEVHVGNGEVPRPHGSVQRESEWLAVVCHFAVQGKLVRATFFQRAQEEEHLELHALWFAAWQGETFREAEYPLGIRERLASADCLVQFFVVLLARHLPRRREERF